MANIMYAPGRYIQGPKVLSDTGSYINHLGSKIFLIGGSTALSHIKEQTARSFDSHSIAYCFEQFSGESTRKNAQELAEKAREFKADIIAGVGGGKAIDTAKAVFNELNAALVIIPTIASSDAPCSAVSVQYHDDHSLDRIMMVKRNPDIVLTDSEIIAKSPGRYFAAGMGDALATWFEAYTCCKSGVKNIAGGGTTAAALSIARLCYDTLMEFGVRAKSDIKNKKLTEAVEKVIEANILLSGIGFESCGLAAAHGINIGLSALEGAKGAMHGELVAFGTITQLVLEKYPKKEIKKIVKFCGEVALPVTLSLLGITDTSSDNIRKAAEIACEEGSTTHNSFFKVTVDMALDAILKADEFGRSV
jgi:glycerol dehydrogenase